MVLLSMPRTVLPKKIKKSSGWKKYQSQAQTHRRLSLGLLVLVLLVIIILLGKFLGFLGSLGRPFAPDGAVQKFYQWDGSSRINLAVKADHLYFLSLNPPERSFQLVKIPDETYLDLPFGFGSWPARSVYGLGQAEKAPMGARLISETMRASFGLPVDGYLILKESLANRPLPEVLEGIRKNPLDGLTFLGQSQTDLTVWEYLRWIWAVRNVRADKVQVIDLGQSRLTSWILLPDGSRSLGLDQLKLDQFMEGRMDDVKLQGEGLSVGIFNTTGHPALAEGAARIISNMGGRAVIVSNFPTKFPKSFVVGKDSYTKKRLAQLFAPDCLKGDPCIPKAFDVNSLRADVNVMIGEDYFLRYNTM